MLFSATFPKRLRDLATEHLSLEHVRFRVGRAGVANEHIKQVVISTDPSMKRQCLLDLINSIPPTRTIIFVNSKRSADELDDFLFNEGLPCTSIHADRTQREREDAMRAFRAGNSPILIATGLSARGIDVRNVCHVINYDLPNMEHGGIEEYTHRIGKKSDFGKSSTLANIFQAALVVSATMAWPLLSTPSAMSRLPPFSFAPCSRPTRRFLTFSSSTSLRTVRIFCSSRRTRSSPPSLVMILVVAGVLAVVSLLVAPGALVETSPLATPGVAAETMLPLVVSLVTLGAPVEMSPLAMPGAAAVMMLPLVVSLVAAGKKPITSLPSIMTSS